MILFMLRSMRIRKNRRPKRHHQSLPVLIVTRLGDIYAAATLPVAWLGLIFLPSLLNLTRGGGARLRRPSRERTLHNVNFPSYVVEADSNIPDDLAVNSARDAVLELQVHLGDSVLGEDGGIGDVTCPLSVQGSSDTRFAERIQQ